MEGLTELVAGLTVGPFALKHALPGTSSAWLAEKIESPHALVVLRRVDPDHSGPLERLLGAAARAEQLHHPQVARGLKTIEAHPSVFLARTFVEGLSALQYLNASAGRALEPKLALWIAHEIARILIDLGPQRSKPEIGHGCLSLGNIVFTPDGNVVLCDFETSVALKSEAFQPIADRRAIGLALLSLSIGEAVPLEKIDDEAVLSTSLSKLEGAHRALVERMLNKDSSDDLRAIEHFLAREFYLSLQSNDEFNGRERLGKIVSALLDTAKHLVTPVDPDPPSIVGVTQALKSRNDPVVPQPLSDDDKPDTSGVAGKKFLEAPELPLPVVIPKEARALRSNPPVSISPVRSVPPVSLSPARSVPPVSVSPVRSVPPVSLSPARPIPPVSITPSQAPSVTRRTVSAPYAILWFFAGFISALILMVLLRTIENSVLEPAPPKNAQDSKTQRVENETDEAR